MAGALRRHKTNVTVLTAGGSARFTPNGALALHVARFAAALCFAAILVSSPAAAPDGPVLENDFVSSKGWVKPGETYPFTLRVLNYGARRSRARE